MTALVRQCPYKVASRPKQSMSSSFIHKNQLDGGIKDRLGSFIKASGPRDDFFGVKMAATHMFDDGGHFGSCMNPGQME